MADAKSKDVGGEDQSMEEILQSIRKIISEEGDEPDIESADENEMPDSVLELTDAVQDDGSVVNVKDDDGDDVLEEIDEALKEKAEAEPEPEPEPEPKPEPKEPKLAAKPAAREVDEDGLVSAASIAASAAALGALKQGEDIGSLPFASGNTVEGLVQQLLRPMLKEWLDANLPDIVQQAVEREVRRISSNK